MDSDKVVSDVDSDVSDIGEKEKWKEEKSSDIEEEERSVTKEEEEKSRDFVSDLEKGDSLEEEKENKEKDLSKKLRVEVLEDFAKGIIDCLKKLPVSVCKLCAQGSENLKYGPIRRRDKVAALEELAQKMLEWRRPDEALMQRKYAQGYDSLVNERQLAMKYHGLDVEFKE